MIGFPHDSKVPDVILFGGIFDPPNLGHVSCLRRLSACFLRSKIIVVPSYRPTANPGTLKEPMLSFPERVSLCRRAFRGIAGLEVSPIECQLPVPSYFFNTITAVKKQYPNQHIAFALGSDDLCELRSWYRPSEVLAKADIIVIDRHGDFGRFCEALGRFSRDFGFAVMWNADHSKAVLISEGGDTRHLHFVRMACSEQSSSSELRTLIRNGQLSKIGLVKMFVDIGETGGI